MSPSDWKVIATIKLFSYLFDQNMLIFDLSTAMLRRGFYLGISGYCYFDVYLLKRYFGLK